MPSEEVLAKLRTGGKLCDHCLGEGFLVAHRFKDFASDPEYDFRARCPVCGGSGLKDECSRPRA